MTCKHEDLDLIRGEALKGGVDGCTLHVLFIQVRVKCKIYDRSMALPGAVGRGLFWSIGKAFIQRPRYESIHSPLVVCKDDRTRGVEQDERVDSIMSEEPCQLVAKGGDEFVLGSLGVHSRVSAY